MEDGQDETSADADEDEGVVVVVVQVGRHRSAVQMARG